MTEFLLDTNVVSELMRPRPDPGVLAWVSARDPASLFVSAVSAAELRAGVAFLPPGRRRDALAAAVDAMLEDDLAGQVLPFDAAAAVAYALIAAARRSVGRPIATLDCQLAATARARGAAVVTRNVTDFEGCGITVVDPWLKPARS